MSKFSKTQNSKIKRFLYLDCFLDEETSRYLQNIRTNNPPSNCSLSFCGCLINNVYVLVDGNLEISLSRFVRLHELEVSIVWTLSRALVRNL